MRTSQLNKTLAKAKTDQELFATALTAGAEKSLASRGVSGCEKKQLRQREAGEDPVFKVKWFDYGIDRQVTGGSFS